MKERKAESTDLFELFDGEQVSDLVVQRHSFQSPTIGRRSDIYSSPLADELCFRQVNLLHQRTRIYRSDFNVPEGF
jgi:hypothetical protein